jgi:hypothetical protein
MFLPSQQRPADVVFYTFQWAPAAMLTARLAAYEERGWAETSSTVFGLDRAGVNVRRRFYAPVRGQRRPKDVDATIWIPDGNAF